MEERLERAEALLRTLLPSSDVSQILTQDLHAQEPSQDLNSTDKGSASDGGQPSSSAQPAGVELPETASFASPTSASTATENTSLLHESGTSAADDDFEWDERESLWSSHDPGAALSTHQGSEETRRSG